MNTNKVSFAKMQEAQANTKATATNKGTEWSADEREFLKEFMFAASIEDIAITLGRTAYAVETILTKDPEFLEIRRKNGDTPEMRTRLKKVEEKQYFVSSDTDVLFGTGD
jgi:hypothetical protein